jgi:hypothetical protein
MTAFRIGTLRRITLSHYITQTLCDCMKILCHKTSQCLKNTVYQDLADLVEILMIISRLLVKEHNIQKELYTNGTKNLYKID